MQFIPAKLKKKPFQTWKETRESKGEEGLSLPCRGIKLVVEPA